ncbi:MULTISPECIES: sigma factor-like helix-turn-helix DNA-binding protein [unclassified Pseudomonas]|uniref:sigma factor-like helix-turn-helix DNA-binding protein n=1 Tax=unclassified Pseudomonas TaxID=196821 RepID=UPI000D3979E3|nr:MULTISPECIES: sigma factor-like helix-turn-helix DNA-binding protein [unclassified Pseudomonas]RAU47580.1 RNA polymerase subunit sigma [Pseudomonas sp. RIT 409]RAU49028.1 RNA polymerase subunit sigma [Pseudomonas sp. RIT 412]
MSGVDGPYANYVSELFQRHHRWLCERLHRQVENVEAAEDIASETFLQLLTSPNVVAIREPRALLTTTAQRLVYQRWRRRGLERKHLDALGDEHPLSLVSPEHLAATWQTLDRIDQRLNRLPSKIRTTFLLSRSVGLTYPEIATRLGISPRSVSDYMETAETCCLRACLE